MTGSHEGPTQRFRSAFHRKGASRTAVPAVAAIAILAAALAPRAVNKMPDFEVYWTAAVRARAAEPLYRAEDGHYQFKYLPAFAVIAIPLGELPLEPAKALWFVVSVSMLALLVAASVKLLPERRKPAWLLVAAAILVMGKFYGHELVLGQVNLLLGVLVVVALLLLREGRDALAGVPIALAIVVKPYAIILLPWLAARRSIGAAATAVLGLTAALVLPVTLYGAAETLALHRSWWQTVTESTAPNLLNQDNVSLAAMYAKWVGPGPLAAGLTAITGVAAIGLAALVFLLRRGVPYPEGLEGALLLTAVPLLSPQGWDYVFLIATPAVVYLVNFEDRLPRPARILTIAALVTIGLSIYDVMGAAAYAYFMSTSVITICFLVVIAALAVLRVRQLA